MLKKTLGALLGVMFALSSSVSAMTFSQPVKVGTISTMNQYGCFEFSGTDYNDGEFYNGSQGKSNKGYGKGVARYGKNEDALYVHYNAYANRDYRLEDSQKDFCRIGGTARQNTFPLDVEFCHINRITSDEGLTLYLVQYEGGSPTLLNPLVIGRKNDGNFIKYLDVDYIKKNYFVNKSAARPWCSKIYTKADTLIFEYSIFNEKTKSPTTFCEFRFKWDDAAQWFGVEQVVY